MKAKINKDRVEITELGFQNSGSVNYYEIECEFDESWNGLTKEIVLAQSITGIHRAIINNKAYIDKDRSGVYEIGFVGYTIENDVKVYQVSTNLVPVNISKGAGEIDVLDDVTTISDVEGHLTFATARQIVGVGGGIVNICNYGSDASYQNWWSSYDWHPAYTNYMTNPLPWTKRYNANSFLRAKIVGIYDKTSGSIKFADSIIEHFYKNDILKKEEDLNKK